VLVVGVEEQAASRARPAKAPNALNFIVKPIPVRDGEVNLVAQPL
jgi:hypothetical protein